MNRIILAVAWGIIGILNLTLCKTISKKSYALLLAVYEMVMLELIFGR